ALLLLAAAWHDIATRLIPDTVCLLVALAGLLLRAAEGLAPLAVSAGLALALFLLLLPAAMRGALGGGDVKLAAALVLGLSPA
ncbi:prepilin peptidase, partial [Acinetobacter baumannii]